MKSPRVPKRRSRIKPRSGLPMPPPPTEPQDAPDPIVEEPVDLPPPPFPPTEPDLPATQTDPAPAPAAIAQAAPRPELRPEPQPESPGNHPLFPNEAQAVIVAYCRNPKLVIIRLVSSLAEAVMWTNGRQWRLGTKLTVKLEQAQGDPRYEAVEGSIQ